MDGSRDANGGGDRTRYYQVGSLKAHMLAVCMLSLLLVVLRNDWRFVFGLPLFWPVMALWAANLLSTATGAAHSSETLRNSIKYVIRWSLGTGTFIAAAYLTDSAWRRRIMVGAVLFGAILTLLFCGLEVVAWDPSLVWFNQFREAAHWVDTPIGVFHRLQGTFPHPNVLAGYAVILLPFGLCACIAAGRPNRHGASLSWRMRVVTRLGSLLGVVALALGGAMLVQTMSRAGMTAAVFAVASIALFALHRQVRGWSRRWLYGCCAATVVGVAAGVAICWPFLTRLKVGPQAVYASAISVDLPVRGKALDVVRVPIRVRPAWPSSGPVNVILADTWRLKNVKGRRRDLRVRHVRRVLPARVERDGWLALDAWLEVPRYAGAYTVSWSVAVEGRNWQDPWSLHETNSEIEVEGTLTKRLVRQLEQRQRAAPPVAMVTIDVAPKARTVMWHAAWALFLKQPWTGLGPDNFRLRSGEVLGQEQWDPRARTHSLYFETLVNLGVVGAAAFGWFTFALFRRAWRLSVPPGPIGVRFVPLGMAMSISAYYAHGAVDFVLGTTQMLCLFFVFVGLICSRARHAV